MRHTFCVQNIILSRERKREREKGRERERESRLNLINSKQNLWKTDIFFIFSYFFGALKVKKQVVSESERCAAEKQFCIAAKKFPGDAFFSITKRKERDRQ